MTGKGHINEHTFCEGNKVAEKHSGESGVKALTTGQPLAGVALGIRADLDIEIAKYGMVAVLEERARRHQTVADLFYQLILGCKDIESLRKLEHRFSNLSNSAAKQFERVIRLEREQKAIDHDAHIIEGEVNEQH